MSEPEMPGGAVDLDQTDWRSPVSDRVAAPSQPGPELLPFHDRSWPDFERIVLVIAEYIDGIRGVRLYGAPGQEQRGIDLWGFDHEGVNVGYQPKRLKSFDERDLAEAVGKFDGEHRAVNAKRLIICVACDADRTQISEALDEQRRAHPDFEIDLYDRRRLSEKLKSRPDLVRRLFGADWAAAFCDNVDWPVPIPTATDVLADALIRGPIMALGLEQDFANCNALALSDPKRAAADLGSIIEALTVGNFAAFAAPLQLQQAELLVASGNTAAAIDILSELAWDRIEAGGNNWDQQSLGRIRALLADGDSSHGAAFVNFVDGINQWYGQPHIDVSALLPQHETFASTEHRLSDLATLWILETAVATGELDAAIALRDRSRAAVIAREPKGLSDPTTVRLRTATADADGDWDTLVRDARSGRLGSRMATLVLMRFGRYCSRRGRPEDADAEYSLAIQTACVAGITSEAAAAVRAIVNVRMRFGMISDDLNAMHRLAYQIESAGSVGLLPGTDCLDAGALAISRNKLPEALRWYRSALRNAVIRGDVTDEESALVGLSDVLRRSGEHAAAVRHAVAAGSTSEIEKSLPLPIYVDVGLWLNAECHWQRATALRAVSLQADVLCDDAVGSYIDIALDALEEPRRSLFAPHVDLNAWKLLAALAERTTDSQADLALDFVAPRIIREVGQYRFEDDDLIQIVVSIAARQPGLQDRTSELLARMIGQGDNFADDVGQAIVKNLRPPCPELIQRVQLLADAGHPSALKTLGNLDIGHPLLLDSVRSDVATTLNAPPPSPGTMEFGTWLPSVARRARVLDEESRVLIAQHCAKLAADGGRPESNRTEGAEGVLLLARHLPDSVRSELFARMMILAQNDDEPTPIDRSLLGGLHPLSTFRLDLDFGSLPREALLAAAALATTLEEADSVAALATTRIVSANVKDVRAAATAIWYLDRTSIDLNVQLFVAHPNEVVRQLAAAVVANSDGPEPDIAMRLANDPAPSVRRTLASGLRVMVKSDPDLVDRLSAVLSHDTNWSVRQELS